MIGRTATVAVAALLRRFRDAGTPLTIAADHLAHGCCGQCGGALDGKGRCWRCCDRPCVDCGRPTGSAFIVRCVQCGHGFNCNGGDWEP